MSNASNGSAREPFVLVIQCPDARGIVAAVSTHLAENDASIEESHQFHDVLGGDFYMRTVFRSDRGRLPDIGDMRRGFAPIASRFKMQWALQNLARRPKVMIAVSKHGHCLYELVHRWHSGLLAVDIVAVVSNHEDMRSFVEWSGIPFHHLPVNDATRAAQERRMLDLVDELGAELIVLARYMQILSAPMVEMLAHRCINIHHSFLPSFKGARPYHQAHARGVKIIGATAHYVTTALDEGPIIEQDVRRVDHDDTPEDLIAIGREIESNVLARAVKWHIEHRIIVSGDRTIMFA